MTAYRSLINHLRIIQALNSSKPMPGSA